MAPSAAPMPAPTSRAAATASSGGVPDAISSEATMPPQATTLPTDRSMLAVRITKVMPTATMPTMLACWNRLEMLRMVRKLSDSSVAITTTAKKMTMKL